MHFLVFSFLGLFLAFKAIQLILKGKQSLSWRAHSAKVTDAQHVSEIGPATRTRKFTHVMVSYTYQVGEEHYRNDRVRFKWNRHRIGDELDKYKPGTEVVAFVNPEDPRDAVLEPGTDITNYMALLSGVSFFIAGIALMVFV